MHLAPVDKRSYQRFCHINEALGSLCIELTLKPLLHVVLKKRKCACRFNSNKVYSKVFCARITEYAGKADVNKCY